MKKSRIVIIVILGIFFVVQGFTLSKEVRSESKKLNEVELSEKQTINMFVTHGHCSTPFAGDVKDLRIDLAERKDLGNPLENMKISFSIDPNTFNVCRGDELTSRIKTPGLFINEDNDQINFRTTDVYTMGLDWYQVNGMLSIKGEERPVKFFVSGIRKGNQTKADLLVLEGQLNLIDWGIDYDKIVHGEPSSIPTKWLHLNMKFKI